MLIEIHHKRTGPQSDSATNTYVSSAASVLGLPNNIEPFVQTFVADHCRKYIKVECENRVYVIDRGEVVAIYDQTGSGGFTLAYETNKYYLARGTQLKRVGGLLNTILLGQDCTSFEAAERMSLGVLAAEPYFSSILLSPNRRIAGAWEMIGRKLVCVARNPDHIHEPVTA